jgi:hypothetical protein
VNLEYLLTYKSKPLLQYLLYYFEMTLLVV